VELSAVETSVSTVSVGNGQMNSLTVRCSLCLYWQQDQKQGTGICRRFAPRPVTEFSEFDVGSKNQGNMAPVCWPATLEWDWCGEFEPINEDGGTPA